MGTYMKIRWTVINGGIVNCQEYRKEIPIFHGFAHDGPMMMMMVVVVAAGH
jgi:hypothetical protein